MFEKNITIRITGIRKPAITKIINIILFIVYKVELAKKAWISKLEKMLGAGLHCQELSLHCVRSWENWVLFLSFRAGREPGGKKGTVKKDNT